VLTDSCIHLYQILELNLLELHCMLWFHAPRSFTSGCYMYYRGAQIVRTRAARRGINLVLPVDKVADHNGRSI